MNHLRIAAAEAACPFGCFTAVQGRIGIKILGIQAADFFQLSADSVPTVLLFRLQNFFYGFSCLLTGESNFAHNFMGPVNPGYLANELPAPLAGEIYKKKTIFIKQRMDYGGQDYRVSVMN